MAVPGGRDVLRDIRQMCSVPVVPVVHRSAEQDLVREFGLGAEDYVTKPFGAGVLLRVIEVVLRLGGKVPRPWEPGLPGRTRYAMSNSCGISSPGVVACGVTRARASVGS